MRTKTTIAVLALAAGTAVAGPARAQDAGEILQDAMEKYAERVEGIDDYTVTYDGFMGQGAFTTYFEKETVDGFPVFRPVAVAGVEPSDPDAFNPWGRFPELADRAAYDGRESVDDVSTHRVTVDDLDGLDLVPPSAGGEFQPESMTMWIDDDALIRRMRIEGTATMSGEPKPMTMVVTLRDYRTVEGMPFPFESAIAVEGAMATTGMSEQEAEESRQRLARLREQLDAMPEAQREQMQRLMGPQIEQLENMLGSGTMEMSMTVQDLKVNTGPPGDS